jgi:hypothetical protein
MLVKWDYYSNLSFSCKSLIRIFYTSSGVISGYFNVSLNYYNIFCFLIAFTLSKYAFSYLNPYLWISFSCSPFIFASSKLFYSIIILSPFSNSLSHSTYFSSSFFSNYFIIFSKFTCSSATLLIPSILSVPITDLILI